MIDMSETSCIARRHPVLHNGVHRGLTSPISDPSGFWAPVGETLLYELLIFYK